MFKAIGRFFKMFKPGPREISSKEMEEEIDKFQDQYDVPEEKLDPMLRNEDESKWKK